MNSQPRSQERTAHVQMFVGWHDATPSFYVRLLHLSSCRWLKPVTRTVCATVESDLMTDRQQISREEEEGGEKKDLLL